MIQDIIKFDLSLPRMGYILAYKSDNSLFSRQIVKAQLKAGFDDEDAQVTHCEISGGSEYSINISPPLSKLIEIQKTHAGRYLHIIRYKNDDYEIKGRYKVAYFSATLCNLRYDIFGILRFLFKWVKQSNRLRFCSEGCSWALKKEYPQALIDLENYEIMPAHFLDRRYFEVVWSGEIPPLS